MKKKVIFTQVALSTDQVAAVDNKGDIWTYTGYPTGQNDVKTGKPILFYAWRQLPSAEIEVTEVVRIKKVKVPSEPTPTPPAA